MITLDACAAFVGLLLVLELMCGAIERRHSKRMVDSAEAMLRSVGIDPNLVQRDGTAGTQRGVTPRDS